VNTETVSIPKLSVVVAIMSDTSAGRVDTSFLRACLTALQAQIDPPPMEIIVPYHRQVEGVAQLQAEFPRVIFVDVSDLISPIVRGGKEHHQEMRALGLARAQGEIVGMVEDVGRPDPRWCAQAMKVHESSDYAAVGGAIENGVDRPLNWAVYFCDFGIYQNPVPAGPTRVVSDANVTFKRGALESVRTVWEKAFYEPEVNAALLAQNQGLALSPDLVVYQHRAGLTLKSAMQERVVWARAYAANRSKGLSIARHVILVVLSPLLPILMLLRMTLAVLRRGRSVRQFLKALPLTVCLVAATAWGELLGYCAGRVNSGAA
jgi:hypothetical protein